MVNKMNKNISNKVIVIISLIAIILIIGIPTAYKTSKIHKTRARMVTKKAIIEAAEKCHFDGKCQNSDITLKELYEFKYLDEQYDPITKKVYDENTTIFYKNNKYEINLK